MSIFSFNEAINVSVGRRVKHLRKYYRMTRVELAKQLGISRFRMKAIELGKCAPSIINGMMLSRIFNVSLDYLLAGEEKETTTGDSGLPFQNLGQHEAWLLNEFMLACSLILPAKRKSDVFYESIRYSLACYMKLMHADLQKAEG